MKLQSGGCGGTVSLSLHINDSLSTRVPKLKSHHVPPYQQQPASCCSGFLRQKRPVTNRKGWVPLGWLGQLDRGWTTVAKQRQSSDTSCIFGFPFHTRLFNLLHHEKRIDTLVNSRLHGSAELGVDFFGACKP